MPTKATVVILCWNKYDLTNRLLWGLYSHDIENIGRIIVVDNASTDETPGGLAWHKASHTRAQFDILTQRENIGFTLGANAGLIEATDGERDDTPVFLISNDVQVNGKFIEQATEILSAPQKHLVGQKLLALDTGWNVFGDKVFPYLEGFLLAATASGWKELGFFDGNYAPFDYEDIDLSTKAKVKGYKLTPLNNPSIIHEGGGTLGYNPEREKITRRNQEYFRKKWVK